jgi:hypothetical protein
MTRVIITQDSPVRSSDAKIAVFFEGTPESNMASRHEGKAAGTTEHFLARVAAIVDSSGGQIPSVLLKTVEALERNAATAAEKQNVADDFERLLARSSAEEKIHAFIRKHPSLLAVSTYKSERATQGLLSKFPISPDRIADFVYLSLALHDPQYPDRIDVFELKRADVSLFTTHNRFSKDLNDAWMEGVESLRLISLNYQDFVRRALKRLIAPREMRQTYMSAVVSDYRRPRVRVRIVIGRRSSLSAEDRARVRELDFSTNSSIAVVTYDTLLDELREREATDITRWRW